MTRRTTLLTACGLAVLAAALTWTRPAESAAPKADSRGTVASVAPVRVERRALPPSAALPGPRLSPHAPGSEEHQAWIDARGAELMKLSWMDDPASLKQILAELENPAAEVRKSALQAVANFGSRDAIPYLESLVAGCEDAQEKIDLIQTAEQLKIETASEYFAKKDAAAGK